MFRLPNIEKEGELEARAGFALKHGLNPDKDKLRQKLDQCLRFIRGKERLDKKAVKGIKKDFHSDEYGFDDVFKTKLLANYVIVNNSDFIDDKNVALVSQQVRSDFFDITLDKDGDISHFSPENQARMETLTRLIGEDGGERASEQTITEQRTFLTKFGEIMVIPLVFKIQGQLALLEIFALVSLDDFLPELLRICPEYLRSCPIVAKKVSTCIMKMQLGRMEMA